ncbi:FG-GAP repeat protein [Candidatus Acetothermia bacterium]|nr:FG-GAP repeat protein [Candidatus Acetothermia bacterium]
MAQDQQNATILGGDTDETLTQFGALVTGDFNGDGLADVAVGAVNVNGPDGLRHLSGAVYVFYGKKDWPKQVDLAKDKDGKSSADVVIYGAQPGDQLGYALAAGDLNGDKTDDLIVSAVDAAGPDGLRTNSGAVYVFYGNSLSGVIDLGKKEEKDKDKKDNQDDKTKAEKAAASVVVYGAHTEDFAGSALATGDINGDKIDDLIIGARFGEDGRTNSGAAYVIFGQNALSGQIDLAQRPGDLVVYGRAQDGDLGRAVASADVNGDGFDDLIVGAPLDNTPDNIRTNAGEVYVIYGKSFEKNAPPTVINLRKTNADVSIYGASLLDHLGQALSHCVRTAGARKCADLNGDGFEDIVIGAPGASGPNGKRAGSGEVVVIFGQKKLPSVIDLADKNTKPSMVVYGRHVTDHLGSSVATGDINGDSFNDLLIGAETANAPAEEGVKDRAGEAYIVYGGKTPPAVVDVRPMKEDPPGPDVTISGANPEDHLGNAVALGDTNGDGFADLFVGAFDADGPAAERTNAGEIYLVYGIGLRPVKVKVSKQSKVVDANGLTVGGLLEYTVTIKNEGKGDQFDNEGNEMIDPTPLGTTVDTSSLKASAGKVTYDPGTRYVVWNGGIPVGETVTITFRVKVDNPAGDLTVRNQAKIRYDSQGLGVNDGVALTNITEDKVLAHPKGDVNLDGQVTIDDAKFLAEYIVRKTDLNDEQKWTADVAEPCRPSDQNIDVTDIRWIAQLVLKLRTKLACDGAPKESTQHTGPTQRTTLSLEIQPSQENQSTHVHLMAQGEIFSDLQIGPTGALRFDPSVVQVLSVKGIEPYEVFDDRIDNQKGEVQFAVAALQAPSSSNAAILDLEIALKRSATSEGLFRLSGVDVLRTSEGEDLLAELGDKNELRWQSEKFSVRNLNVKLSPNPVRGAGSAIFSVQGDGVLLAQVQVFDLAGRAVFTSGWSKGDLVWKLQTQAGKSIASGVYLYTAWVRGPNGKIFATGLKKFIVQR